MSTHYQFMPWTRTGATTGVVTPDPLDASIPARVALPVKLRVNDRVDVDIALRVYGPGDVTGIDTLQIARSDPAPFTSDFEPNYFPSIEFDRPDFPWLFTPAAANAEGRLRPWLFLIVVRKQNGIRIDFRPDQPLPVLTITAPAVPRDELPDLSESWAWCHSQVVTTVDGATVEAHLRDDTVQTVSRLICPRRLEPDTGYLACLVPAFEAGVNAGLGLTLNDNDLRMLQPAWHSGDAAPASVTLPVFYQWEFGTGIGGDFEALVRRLQGRPLPAGVGSKAMMANDLGLQLPDAGLLRFDGALMAPSSEPSRVASPQFQAQLEHLLNLPSTQLTDAGVVNEDGPIVAPPIYGRWQASVSRLESQAGWLRDLNLNPWARAVAGLGTLVVQDQQEQLMAAAWEQLGELSHQRRVLEQPKFARAILHSVYQRRFNPLLVTQFFQITAPAHARLKLDNGTSFAAADSTVQVVLGSGDLPKSLTSAALRRVARPRSHLFRKINRTQTRPRSHALMVRGQAVLFQIKRKPAPRPVSDSVTRQLVGNHVTRLRGVLAFGFPAGSADVRDARETLVRMIDSAQEVNQYFDRAIKDGIALLPKNPRLDILKSEVLGKINPVLTVSSRPTAPSGGIVAAPSLKASLSDASSVPDTFINGPSFPQPMYEALRDLSQEYLLPGAEHIPNNTVTLLQTNAQFVESYLVGLNHEMSRELLWREYPSDQRQTNFRNFWDGNEPTLQDGSGQVPPLHQWDAAKALGEHFFSNTVDGQLVLLIRGELLRRYPNTLIYAVKAQSRNKLGEQRLSAQFFGRLNPDISFVGFSLDVASARGTAGDPGWFFVIEQPLTEPRFGLDEAADFGRDPATIGSWNDLAWSDLVDSDTELKALSHVPLGARLTGKVIGSAAWARNGGHLAAITLQRPVRVALHAADLLAAED